MIQFDLRIFFRWVGEKPPTSYADHPPRIFEIDVSMVIFVQQFPRFQRIFSQHCAVQLNDKLDRQFRESLFRKQRFSHVDLLFVSPNAACIWNVYIYLPTFYHINCPTKFQTWSTREGE